MDWTVNSLEGLPAVAEEITKNLDEKIVLLHGNMGAGKTTLIKEICKSLGVPDKVSSPTFSIVNEYQSNSGQTIYHFDFYRLKSEEEAYDFGYEEYFFSDAICLVEWPEKIANLLPSKFGLVKIAQNNDTREISFQPSTSSLPF